MQKDKVILLVAVALLIGFVVGAVTGIRFTTKEQAGQAKPIAAGDAGSPETEKTVPREDVEALEKALKADPNNLNALVSLGNIYFDTRQHKKAIEMYERALKIDPKNADVRTDMAIMYRNLKDFDRAVKELRAAAEADPSHGNSRYNLGIVLLHDKHDLKGAIAAWEDFLKVEPMGGRAEMIRQRLVQLRTMVK